MCLQEKDVFQIFVTILKKLIPGGFVELLMFQNLRITHKENKALRASVKFLSHSDINT